MIANAKQKKNSSKQTAIYVRVSTTGQDTASQLPELTAWSAGKENVVWYTDKASGKSMDRPDWTKLMKAVHQGKVREVAVWRVDRLGRTAKGLTALFDELATRRVNLVSLRDGLDLATPAGRLMANVLASVAQYETEVRGERIAAGQAIALAKGKRWGGRKKGSRQIHQEQIDAVVALRKEGKTPTEITRATKLSKPTVYSILVEHKLHKPKSAKAAR